MTEPTFFVLISLVGEPRNGSGIVSEVNELSGGRIQMKINSLYGMLDRLLSEGLIELDRDEGRQGRQRRYYRLTDAGFHAIRTETARQAANSRAATRRLSLVRPQRAGSS